jgi:hypothetical protein
MSGDHANVYAKHAIVFPTLPAGYYLAHHPKHRPQVVEFCTVGIPHWRGPNNDRLPHDPRDLGYYLEVIRKPE